MWIHQNLSLESIMRKKADLKARFHYERGKEHFFLSFIDLRSKRAVKIEVSAKKKAIKQTKNAFFHYER